MLASPLDAKVTRSFVRKIQRSTLEIGEILVTADRLTRQLE